MSVRRAQQEIDAPEFTEWIAYYNLEPFGQVRDDIRIGHAACCIASAIGVKNAKVSQFMPDFGKKRKPQSAEEMRATLMAAFGVHNAKEGL